MPSRGGPPVRTQHLSPAQNAGPSAVEASAKQQSVLLDRDAEPSTAAARGQRERHLATALLWPLNRLHGSGGIRPKRRRVPLRRRGPVADGRVIAVRLSS